MICFNCGKSLSSSEFCSNCGTKVTTYKKIIRMSNTYYNIGLLRANNRDLSGAADMLRRSLRFNKRNTMARNLLGVVYYEMGETVQALSEWVISQNFRPDRNPANEYIRRIQSNANKLNEMNYNIKKFNVALKYAKSGNDDMAIIQLKKVLSQNPRMIKGHELLTLLYMKSEEYERARRTIRRALKVDKCNPLCLRYQTEIERYIMANRKNPDKRNRHLKDPITDRTYLSGDAVIIPPHSFREPSNNAMTILNVVVGLILGALAMYFLVTPVKIQNEVDKNNDIVLDYNQKIAVKNSSISEMERQIETLTKEKESAEKSVNKNNKSIEKKASNYENLIIALQKYTDKDYLAGATAIGAIDSEIKMSSELFDKVYLELATNMNKYLPDAYYEAGDKAFNSGDYKAAIEQFKKCLEADDTRVDALYQMAWSYYNLGDADNSTETFKKVIIKFPNSEEANKAKKFVTVD